MYLTPFYYREARSSIQFRTFFLNIRLHCFKKWYFKTKIHINWLNKKSAELSIQFYELFSFLSSNSSCYKREFVNEYLIKSAKDATTFVYISWAKPLKICSIFWTGKHYAVPGLRRRRADDINSLFSNGNSTTIYWFKSQNFARKHQNV